MYGKLNRWTVRISFALISLTLLGNSIVGAQQVGDLQLGKQDYAAGRYMEAERHLRAAAARAEDGGSDQEKVSTFANLGAVLLTQSRFKEAEESFNRGLEIAEHSAAVDSVYAPIMLAQLAAVYHKTGRIKLAETTFDRAFRLAKTNSLDPRWKVVLHNNAGALCVETGKYKEASDHFKKAVEQAEASPNPRDNSLALVLTNLASLHAAQRKWSLAESVLAQSLQLTEQSVGPDHPDVALVLTNLGFLRFKRKASGEESIDAAVAASNLAEVLAAQGAYPEAQRLYATSLQMQEHLQGSRHSQMAITLERFADLLRRTVQGVQAEEMTARARSLRAQEKYTVNVYR
jgi:tetratricopeptide (TPR) repeat protein